MSQLTYEQNLLLSIMKNIMNIEEFASETVYLKNTDWDIFLELCVSQRVFILAYKAIYKYLPKKYKESYKSKFNFYMDRIEYILDEIQKIVKLAEEKHIRVLINKGIAFSKIIYNDNYSRQFNDIDLIVEEDDVLRMDSVIREIGYFQAYSSNFQKDEFKLMPFPYLKDPSHHHYYEYFKNVADKKYVKLELARHLHTINEKHINEVLWHCQEIEINNFTIKTFDLYHTLLILCENAFADSERIYMAQRNGRIRDYVDIFVFCNKYRMDIDWNKFKALALKYNILDQNIIVFENLTSIYNEQWINSIIDILKHNYKYIKYPNIQWENDLTYRILSDIERREQVKKYIKQKIYKKERMDQECYFKAACTKEFDFRDPKNYINFENKYCQDIRYTISYDDKNLIFSVHMENIFFKELDKYILEFVVFNNNLQSKNLYNVIDFKIGEDGLICNYTSLEILTNTNNARKDGQLKSCNGDIIDCGDAKIIKAATPINAFEFDLTSKPLKAAYVFKLLKYIHEDIYDLKDSTMNYYDSLFVEIPFNCTTDILPI